MRIEFHNFLSTHNPAQFNNNLRRLFMDHIDHALRTGIFPNYLNDLTWPLNDLLDLLETAAKEFPQPAILEKKPQRKKKK